MPIWLSDKQSDFLSWHKNKVNKCFTNLESWQPGCMWPQVCPRQCLQVFHSPRDVPWPLALWTPHPSQTKKTFIFYRRCYAEIQEETVTVLLCIRSSGYWNNQQNLATPTYNNFCPEQREKIKTIGLFVFENPIKKFQRNLSVITIIICFFIFHRQKYTLAF